MDPFLGEIRAFGFNFAPRGWAQCDGQLVPIQQYSQLFSLLGTHYGGDGRTTFALPDLRERAAVNQGQGRERDLPPFEVGQWGGTPTVTLTEAETPRHTHTPQASPEPADVQAPGPDRALARSTPGNVYQGNVTEDLVQMYPYTTTSVGGSQPHENRSPCQVVRFCISLQGEFPPRSESE